MLGRTERKMTVDQGSFPPTRSQNFKEERDEYRVLDTPSGSKVAMLIIAIAAVLGALLYGLSTPKKTASGVAGAYGDCKVEDGRRTQFVMTCKDHAVFPAAFDEFLKKNPGQKVSSVSVWFK